MPFIGTQPEVGGYSVLDALTASATASYTLQLNSANFVPNTANQLLVSLNGVIQKPGSSFTVSGSTLTFSSALTSSDSIDFIISMGEPLLIGTPSDGTVSTAKIANDAVTGAKIENNPTIAGNLTVSGTSTNTGLITASAGVAIGGTGSANTLDDYEEGTFTAVRRTFQNDAAAWYGNEANLTNMSGVTSRYTKIGRMVSFYIPRQNVPTDNCSLYRITGLPFTALNDSHGDGTSRYPVQYEEHRGFRGRYNNSETAAEFQLFYYTYGNATEIIPGVTHEDTDGSLYPMAQTASGSAFPAVMGFYETAL